MVTKQDVAVFKGELEKMSGEFEKVLPKAIPSAKFMRSVMTTIQLNPGIVAADSKSILSCCMKAAADGLVLDGREAALVVYRGKNGPVANYLPMVQGIIKKVRQSGDVSIFNATCVYEKDEFEITYGLEPDIKHVPPTKGERGDCIGAYAVAKFKDGTVDFEYMTYNEIEAIRGRSKSKNNGPWVTDWSEMARKTVIRRLAKRLPMSVDTMDSIRRIDELYDLEGEGEAPSRKKRGAGAAALGGIETDPDTGEPIDDDDGSIIDVTAEEVEDPKPEPKPAKTKPKGADPKKGGQKGETKEERAARLRRELEELENDDTEQEAEEEDQGDDSEPEASGEGEGVEDEGGGDDESEDVI